MKNNVNTCYLSLPLILFLKENTSVTFDYFCFIFYIYYFYIFIFYTFVYIFWFYPL